MGREGRATGVIASQPLRKRNAVRSALMASLTPEVIDVLFRLAKGEINVKDRTDAELYKLAEALINSRESLAEVLSELNNRDHTFAEIGKQLGIHEATAARWAKPPSEDRRRRRRGEHGE